MKAVLTEPQERSLSDLIKKLSKNKKWGWNNASSIWFTSDDVLMDRTDFVLAKLSEKGQVKKIVRDGMAYYRLRNTNLVKKYKKLWF